MLFNYAKKKMAKKKAKKYTNAKAKKEAETQEKEEETSLNYNVQSTIDVLITLQAIGEDSTNDIIKDMTLDTHKKLKELYKRPCEQLSLLLNYYGFPEDIISEFEKAERKKEEEKKAKELEEELAKKREEGKDTTKIEKESKRARSQMKSEQNQLVPSMKSKNKNFKQMQIVPYKQQFDFTLKAREEFERIKRLKEHREEQVFYCGLLLIIEKNCRGDA